MLRTFGVRLVPQGVNTIIRAYGAQSSTTPTGAKHPATPAINPNVEGLSENCVKVPNHPVGPGASKEKEYKNPEYFCYNSESFAEAEVEIAKYRLPAPSNKVKFNK
ncbi:uncharacterized protein LOC117171872 [Belonocnema kinseyi]|uniref:uncharacterized protein LOC117171872 n=1 Tax=Belonocnema kinseyi TaxID=2817044 RepID=UPI00143CF388|nr:uncharacterized protein LOC117171872 [Belonocnema kinseyi]